MSLESMNVNMLTCVALGYWTLAALWAGFRGMIRTVLSFLVIILSIVITMTATPVVYRSLHSSAYVNNYLQQQSGTIIDNLADGIASGTGNTGWLEILPLPEEVRAAAELGDNDIVAQIIRSDSVKSILSFQLANTVARIAATIFTAIGSFLVLTVIRFILLRIADLPGISAADHFLGFVFGIAKGLIVIWIALLIIRLVALTGNGTGLIRQVRESDVLSMLDEYNMVRRLIVSLIAGSH